jgi:hypothetical protein
MKLNKNANEVKEKCKSLVGELNPSNCPNAAQVSCHAHEGIRKNL